MERYVAVAPLATPATAPAANPGYPTDGNPSTGIPAGQPGAWWFHMITEELRAVIVAAGLTPNHASVVQLLAALRSTGVFETQAAGDNTTKVATTAWAKLGFVVSLGSTNGYIKFPDWLGGLIVQWGQVTNSATISAGTLVTFPVAFPTAARACLISNATTSTSGATATATALTTTNFQSTSSVASLVAHWLAVGY